MVMFSSLSKRPRVLWKLDWIICKEIVFSSVYIQAAAYFPFLFFSLSLCLFGSLSFSGACADDRYVNMTKTMLLSYGNNIFDHILLFK